MATAAPRKLPTQERSKATVEAILGAAARVLIQDGMEGATTNRIAKVAGVSIGSLYQYFPNRDAIFAALVEDHCAKMTGLLETTAVELLNQPIPVAVDTYVRAMIDAHALEPELHGALMRAATQIYTIDDIVAFERQSIMIVKAYLEAHRTEILPDDLDLAAFILVTTVESATHAAIVTHPERMKDGRLADEITALVCRYLGVEKRSFA